MTDIDTSAEDFRRKGIIRLERWQGLVKEHIAESECRERALDRYDLGEDQGYSVIEYEDSDPNFLWFSDINDAYAVLEDKDLFNILMSGWVPFEDLGEGVDDIWGLM